MKTNKPNVINICPDINKALRLHQPIVALESTVLTHGLPFPENLQLASDIEKVVLENNAIPATIALLKGKVQIGLNASQKEELIRASNVRKISRRDFGIAIARKEFGGTTVAATMIIAQRVGIKVFATGGIGGVHREPPGDISADLVELSRCPMIVVCSGAKAILDLPVTLEYLETMGVPVIGYQTDEFPAFYSRSSGSPVSVSVSSPEEASNIVMAHWEMGLSSAVLIVVPPPERSAINREEIEIFIQQAIKEAATEKVTGSALTPYLLNRINELSHGMSLRVNIDLLLNNAGIAARIARALQPNAVRQYA